MKSDTYCLKYKSTHTTQTNPRVEKLHCVDGYLLPCLYDPKEKARLARQSHSLSQVSSSVSITAETSCSPALKSPTDLCWSNSGEATTAAFRSFLPAEDALGLDFRFGDLLDFLREGDGDNFDLTTSGETCQISY